MQLVSGVCESCCSLGVSWNCKAASELAGPCVVTARQGFKRNIRMGTRGAGLQQDLYLSAPWLLAGRGLFSAREWFGAGDEQRDVAQQGESES